MLPLVTSESPNFGSNMHGIGRHFAEATSLLIMSCFALSVLTFDTLWPDTLSLDAPPVDAYSVNIFGPPLSEAAELNGPDISSELDFNLDQTSMESETDAAPFSPISSFATSSLEASCTNDEGQKLDKMRHRRRQLCDKKETLTPPKVPNPWDLEPGSDERDQPSQNLEPSPFGLDLTDDDSECPGLYNKHVCCRGPSVQSFVYVPV